MGLEVCSVTAVCESAIQLLPKVQSLPQSKLQAAQPSRQGNRPTRRAQPSRQQSPLLRRQGAMRPSRHRGGSPAVVDPARQQPNSPSSDAGGRQRLPARSQRSYTIRCPSHRASTAGCRNRSRSRSPQRQCSRLRQRSATAGQWCSPTCRMASATPARLPRSTARTSCATSTSRWTSSEFAGPKGLQSRFAVNDAALHANPLWLGMC